MYESMHIHVHRSNCQTDNIIMKESTCMFISNSQNGIKFPERVLIFMLIYWIMYTYMYVHERVPIHAPGSNYQAGINLQERFHMHVHIELPEWYKVSRKSAHIYMFKDWIVYMYACMFIDVHCQTSINLHESVNMHSHRPNCQAGINSHEKVHMHVHKTNYKTGVYSFKKDCTYLQRSNCVHIHEWVQIKVYR